MLGKLTLLFGVVLMMSCLSACTSCPVVKQGDIHSYQLRPVHLTLPKHAEDIQPRRTLEDIDYNNRVIEGVQ
jgi:hypothetical protein